MKRLFVIILNIILICTGCSLKRYDYSNWEKYQFPNEHSFSYPKTWESESTESGLLYFYENGKQGNKIIMSFQSHIDSSSDKTNTAIVEKNALSDTFQVIKSIHYETGPSAFTLYGIDLVSVDLTHKELKYIEFNPQAFSQQEIVGGYSYKMYFTDEVSDEIFWQIYHSCE